MNWKKLSIYLLIPAGVSIVLNALYFSRTVVLQRIVSPKLPPLALDTWREFGLLENLQNLLLLAMAGIAIAGVVRKRWTPERAAFALIALFAVFVFAEEIDYGTHFYEYATSDYEFQWFQPAIEWPPAIVEQMSAKVEPKNLHNNIQIGPLDLTDVFKHLTTAFMLVVFVVLPLLSSRIRHPLVRYLTPDRHIILTVLFMFVLRQVTHSLADAEEAIIENAVRAGAIPPFEMGSISSNLSEFRELITYYGFMVYLADIVFCRSIYEDTAPAPAEGHVEG